MLCLRDAIGQAGQPLADQCAVSIVIQGILRSQSRGQLACRVVDAALSQVSVGEIEVQTRG